MDLTRLIAFGARFLPGGTIPGPVYDPGDVVGHQHRRATHIVDDGRRAHRYGPGRRLRGARRGYASPEGAHQLCGLQMDWRDLPALYGLANLARRAVAAGAGSR